jgi:2-methylcitrate dehydratase PrpD
MTGDADGWIDAIAACAGKAPPGPQARAREIVLDGYACILAAGAHSSVRGLARALAIGHPGGLVWPGMIAGLSPAGAAALGAAAACWDEACEGLAVASGRPALPVVPLALALGAASGASWTSVEQAVLIGYEIGARAGQAWRIKPGWHVDGGWHALGAAATAAFLMSGPTAIPGAVRSAACQIPASLYLPIAAGTPARNIYPAHAALLGHLCAAAAAADIDGPIGALDEARKLVLDQDYAADVAPPEHWLIEDAYLKPYAGARHVHYGAAAAIALRPRLPVGERPTAISLSTYAEAATYCANRAPTTPIQAQFSITYAVAAALVLGDLGPSAYTPAALGNPDIRRLEALMEVRIETGFRRGAELTIEAPVAGRIATRVEAVSGDPGLPFSSAALRQKFVRFAGPVLGEARARDFAEAVSSGMVSPGDFFVGGTE